MQRRTLVSGLAAAAAMAGTRRLLANSAESPRAGACRLITQDLTGPFHVDEVPIRSDVREGELGVPLTLEFQVTNAVRCAPLPGALVTIWHASRDGLYSRVENILLTQDMRPTGEVVDRRQVSFLRGTQESDGEGRVRFQTVFPGWYHPRPTHIHVRVVPPTFGEVATTQLYPRNADCDAVYATEHYRHRGPSPNRSEPGQESPLFATEAGDLWLNLERSGEGYLARHELGVAFYGTDFGRLSDFYRQS